LKWLKGQFFRFPSNLKNQHSAIINLLPAADTTSAYFDALGRHPWTACSLLPL
jgi:hypothetical protein